MNLSTLSYVFARSPISTLAFSGVTGTTSVHLNGPGGQAGDGFSLPRDGVLTRLELWDGTTRRYDLDEISFTAGDRLAVYCQNMGTNFTVKVRFNGVSTALQIENVPHNSTLFAVVEFSLLRE
jgi:hypothetical protein